MTATKDKRKSADVLKGRLEDYSAAARTGAARATLRQRMGNWPIYAAATGSAVAMATGASADTIIAYTGAPVTISQPGNDTKNVRIDLPLLSHDYLMFEVRHYAISQVAEAIGGPFQSVWSTSSYVKEFASGAVVGAGGGSWNSNILPLMRHAAGNFYGNWAAGVSGFEGFRFSPHNNGQFDYGWAKVEVGVDGSGHPDSITLLAMAYNNNGASIDAGQTSSSPEPGTAGLMLLALGAAGVTALRKRKQSAPV